MLILFFQPRWSTRTSRVRTSARTRGWGSPRLNSSTPRTSLEFSDASPTARILHQISRYQARTHTHTHRHPGVRHAHTHSHRHPGIRHAHTDTLTHTNTHTHTHTNTHTHITHTDIHVSRTHAHRHSHSQTRSHRHPGIRHAHTHVRAHTDKHTHSRKYPSGSIRHVIPNCPTNGKNTKVLLRSYPEHHVLL